MAIPPLLPPPWIVSSDVNRFNSILEVKAPLPRPLIRPIVYGRDRLPPTDEDLSYLHSPAKLRVRSAEEVVLLPRNVVVDANSSELLETTFLRSRKQVHGGVARIPKSDTYELRYRLTTSNVSSIEAPLLFADTDRPDVYGHALLESLTRLWALKRIDSDLRVATSVPINKNYAKMFSCLGVKAEQILHITTPIFAKKVIFPDLPMLRRTWIHPVAWEVFNCLRTLERLSTVSTPDRIYISRSRVAGRGMVNEAEVEHLFREKGFAIVHPQELPIEDQIKLFSHARCVAAAGGSGAHNALFASQKSRVLILSSESWIVNADMLLSQSRGRLAYVIGEPLGRSQDKKRSQVDWRINIDQVRYAIDQHF